MSLDTFITVAGFALVVLCGLGCRYFSDNVKLRYKDQRIPTEVRK